MALKKNIIAAERAAEQDAAINSLAIEPEIMDSTPPQDTTALVVRGVLHGHLERLNCGVHERMDAIGEGITELCEILDDTKQMIDRATVAAKTQRDQVDTFIKLQGLYSNTSSKPKAN
jgi:hypothetical protein